MIVRMDTERAEKEAAEWIVRSDRGELSAGERADFEGWLAADSANRAAYLALKQPWQRADDLRIWRPKDGELDTLVLKSAVSRPARHWQWFTPVAATIVIAVIGAVLWVGAGHTLGTAYRTEVGGFQRLVLRDGSTLKLNTNTQVRVQLTKERRKVHLLHGEAFFNVAHDPNRPFEVIARDTTVRAVGTAFAVRVGEAEAVEVSVTEGRVALRTANTQSMQASDPQSAEPPMLSAGEAAVAKPGGLVVRRLPREELARRLSWQQGELSFQGESLVEVVAEFNRYNRRQLVIADPQIATLQVGGNFEPTDLDGFLAALQRSFPVSVAEIDDIVRLSAGEPERRD